jgi:hypothetical protein
MNIHNILAIQPKGDAPVSGNGNRELPFSVAFERMKFVARQVHVLGFSGSIQPVENALNAWPVWAQLFDCPC